MKQELIKMICQKSFKYSDKPIFKLVSDKMSRLYVNCKPVILNPIGMFLVGHLVYEAIKDSNVDGIGGLTFGADPLTTNLAIFTPGHKPFDDVIKS